MRAGSCQMLPLHIDNRKPYPASVMVINRMFQIDWFQRCSESWGDIFSESILMVYIKEISI